MSALRRWLAISLLAVWWGGFTFYSVVVVHTGHRVLRSKVRQGFITQQVTRQLNVLGIVTLAPLLGSAGAADGRTVGVTISGGDGNLGDYDGHAGCVISSSSAHGRAARSGESDRG